MQEILQNPGNSPNRFPRFQPSAAGTNWSWAEDRHHHCWCRSCQSQRWNGGFRRLRLGDCKALQGAWCVNMPCPFLMSHVSVHRDSVKPRWICNTLAKCRTHRPPNRKNLHPIVYPKKRGAIWRQLETSWMNYSATIKWWLKDRVGQSLQDCVWWWFRQDFATDIASDFTCCGCPWIFRSSYIIDARWYTCTDAKHETTTGTSRLMIWRDAKRWAMLICPQSLPSALRGDHPGPLQDKGIRITSHGPQLADTISSPAFLPMLIMPSYQSIITTLFLGMTHAQGAPKKEAVWSSICCRNVAHSECTINVVQIRFQDQVKPLHILMLLTCVNSWNPAWRWSLRIQQAQQHHSPQQHRECCQHPRGNTQLICKLSHLVWAKAFKRFWMAVVFVGCFSNWRTWKMVTSYITEGHIDLILTKLVTIPIAPATRSFLSQWRSWNRKCHRMPRRKTKESASNTEVGSMHCFEFLVWYHGAGSAMCPTACFSFYLPGPNQQKSISLRIGCGVNLPFSEWEA